MTTTLATELVQSGSGDVLGTFDTPAMAATEARRLLKLHGAGPDAIEAKDGFSCFLRLAAASKDPHPALEPSSYQDWCRAPRSH